MTELRKRSTALAAALAGGIALAGCGMTPESGTSSPPDVTLKQKRYEATADLDPAAQPVRAASYDVPRGTYALEGRDRVLVRAPEMDAYLREVLNRVAQPIESADYSGDVGVFLTSQPTLAAFTTPADEILVSLGAIEKVKSEEELAFLLAHELSHVVRRDIVERGELMGGQDRAAYRIKQLVQAGTKLAAEGQARLTGEPAQNQEILKLRREIAIAVHGLQLALENNVGPAWTLEQERTADRVAADLLYKAGYNPLNAAAIFGKLGEAAAQRKSEVDRHIQEIKDLAKQLAALREDDPLIAELKAAGIDVGADALEGVIGFFQTDPYDAADEREEAYRAYVAERYGVEQAGLGKVRELKRLKERDTTFAAIHQRIRTARNAEELFDEAYAKPETAPDRETGLAESVTKARQAISGVGSDAGFPRLVFHRIRKQTGKDRLARLNLERILERPKLGPAPDFISARFFAEQGQKDRALALVEGLQSRYGEPPTYPLAYEVHSALGDEKAAKRVLDECLDKATTRRFRLQCREFEQDRERQEDDPGFFEQFGNAVGGGTDPDDAAETSADDGTSSDGEFPSLFN